MNCPYCSKPMETGEIPGRREAGIFWIPEEADIMVSFAEWELKEKGGITLTEPKFFGFPSLKAYICRACKKGMFDLP